MKKKIIKFVAGWLSVLFVISCVGFFAACSSAPPDSVTEEDAQSKAPKRKDSKRAEKESMEKDVEKVAEYSYDPTGKRDPFIVPVPPEPDCTPKTCYDLEQMRIDCIIWGSGMEVAHVLLPSGKDVIVKKGDELGINHGRVKFIGDINGQNTIVVEEIYVDPLKPADIHIIEKHLVMEEKKRR